MDGISNSFRKLNCNFKCSRNFPKNVKWKFRLYWQNNEPITYLAALAIDPYLQSVIEKLQDRSAASYSDLHPENRHNLGSTSEHLFI